MTDAATASPFDLDLPGFEQPAVEPAHCTGPTVQLTGTLAAPAEVRARPVDGAGHMLPVLCLDVISDTAGRQRLHCERPYTEAQRAQAEQLARRLTKGARVTLRTPLAGMRITLPHVQHVDLIPTPQETRA